MPYWIRLLSKFLKLFNIHEATREKQYIKSRSLTSWIMYMIYPREARDANTYLCRKLSRQLVCCTAVTKSVVCVGLMQKTLRRWSIMYTCICRCFSISEDLMKGVSLAIVWAEFLGEMVKLTAEFDLSAQNTTFIRHHTALWTKSLKIYFSKWPLAILPILSRGTPCLVFP